MSQSGLKKSGLPIGRAIAGACVVFLASCLLLVTTSPITPMVWDEGDAIVRAAAIPDRWEYTVVREGHPSGYGLLIRLGNVFAGNLFDPLTGWRIGPICLFALALSFVFFRLARDYSAGVASASVSAALLMPRLFAHAHYASFDGPLTACWLLTWAGYATWVRRVQIVANKQAENNPDCTDLSTRPGCCSAQLPSAQRYRPVAPILHSLQRYSTTLQIGPLLLTAVALGATMSCKATGWLAIVPLLIWSFGCWISAICVSSDVFNRLHRTSRGLIRRMVPHALRQSAPTPDSSKAVPPDASKPCCLKNPTEAMVARRTFAATLILLLPTALVVFILMNPSIGNAPLAGIQQFWMLNLHRNLLGLNISTQFFGRLYNLDHPLPWYNTLVWTAITVPPGLLGLAILGTIGPWARRFRREPRGAEGQKRLEKPPFEESTALLSASSIHSDRSDTGLIVAHWAVLLIVRAFPGTPPHDAERLILPSFAFLAILCGIGVGHLSIVLGRYKLLASAIVIIAYATAIAELVWYSPQWLSYYTPMIGGLRGATALGLEPTYYWDAFDDEVIGWLNDHTEPDQRVLILAGPTDNLRLLRSWGVVRFETDRQSPKRLRWQVVQHRPSSWQPEVERLQATSTPAFVKRIRNGGWGPWRLDVPLLWVYPVDASPKNENE